MPLPAGSQNNLPNTESFFVVCEKLNPVQLGYIVSSISAILGSSRTCGEHNEYNELAFRMLD